MTFCLCLLFLISIFLPFIYSSDCGNSAIPFSFEALPNGQTVLGCAKATCFGWFQNGSDAGTDTRFYKVDGKPDGYLRSQAFDKRSLYFEKKSERPELATCEPKYNSKNCGFAYSWVGGISPSQTNGIKKNSGLKLKCCTYRKLIEDNNQDQFVAEVHLNQMVIGGEVIVNNEQYFEYIADVHKNVNGKLHVVYTITTRRFKCPRTHFSEKKSLFKKLNSKNVSRKLVINKKVPEDVTNVENNAIIDKVKNKKILNLEKNLYAEISEAEKIMRSFKINKSNGIANNINRIPGKFQQVDIRKAPSETRSTVNIQLDSDSADKGLSKWVAYWDSLDNKWKYKSDVNTKAVKSGSISKSQPDADSIINYSHPDYKDTNLVTTTYPSITINTIRDHSQYSQNSNSDSNPQNYNSNATPQNYNNNLTPQNYNSNGAPQNYFNNANSQNYNNNPTPQNYNNNANLQNYNNNVTPQNYNYNSNPQKTIDFMGQQLVPGRSYKVYDSLFPNIPAYTFVVPNELSQFATESPSAINNGASTLSNFQKAFIQTTTKPSMPPNSLHQALNSLMQPHHHPIISHDVSTFTLPFSLPLSSDPPLTQVTTTSHIQGNGIFERISRTILGNYANHLI